MQAVTGQCDIRGPTVDWVECDLRTALEAKFGSHFDEEVNKNAMSTETGPRFHIQG
jgi:hypothetical protein